MDLMTQKNNLGSRRKTIMTFGALCPAPSTLTGTTANTYGLTGLPFAMGGDNN